MECLWKLQWASSQVDLVFLSLGGQSVHFSRANQTVLGVQHVQRDPSSLQPLDDEFFLSGHFYYFDDGANH